MSDPIFRPEDGNPAHEVDNSPECCVCGDSARELSCCEQGPEYLRCVGCDGGLCGDLRCGMALDELYCVRCIRAAIADRDVARAAAATARAIADLRANLTRQAGMEKN